MGKSTLLLQALGRLAASGSRCLLVGAEESPSRSGCRAERIGALHPGVLLTGAGGARRRWSRRSTRWLPTCSRSTPSRPSPTRRSRARPGRSRRCVSAQPCSSRVAKARALPTVLVGHVTKDGTLAGPRVLEHVVDTVLSFDGDRHHGLRFLRAVKHRFGATTELGVFEMHGDGLADVPDASALFLADRRPDTPGSVVAPVLEGAGRCSSRCRHWWHRRRRRSRAAPRPGSTGRASRCCSRCSTSEPASRSDATTCTRASREACGSRSRASTSPSRSRSPASRGAAPAARRDGRPRRGRARR